MMAVLTHESRNPFQRLQANLEMLQGEVSDRPEALALADRAIKAQADIERLFRDVHEYARPMQLELELCNLGDTFAIAWSQLAIQRLHRKVHLVAEASGVNLECRADSYRLEQVFRNLLDNALAACQDPVELTVHWSEVQHGGQAAVRFVLQDNGPGLSVEVREKLFEPFFTTKSKGTGLGMAIAKRIVESHGGRIVAANGQSGAEFVITLPRKLAPRTEFKPGADP
jgi:signal transduction histidine kinase